MSPAVDRSRLRIAYLAHGVDGRTGGVRAKILGQASAWPRLDPSIDVGVFVRVEAGTEQDWVGEDHVIQVRSSRAGILGRLIERERLTLDVRRWRPHLVYLRQSTVSPSLIALASTTPTVVELNTLDLAELRLRSRWRYWYARLARDTLLRAARGIVAVSQPIADDRDVTRLQRPTVVVPNGIDLDLHQPLPAALGPKPRLVFLGTPGAPWHGVDKIARLARLEPSWTIDVVGPDRDALSVPPHNVRMHGLLAPEQVRPILAAADVAIGPLAFHRLGLTSASPLKVAEYLAHGIATIIAYRDERFPTGAEFLLELPNSEDNVETSIDAIRAFVRRWVGRRVSRAAVAPIDVRRIEERRLTFLRSVLSRNALAGEGV